MATFRITDAAVSGGSTLPASAGIAWSDGVVTPLPSATEYKPTAPSADSDTVYHFDAQAFGSFTIELSPDDWNALMRLMRVHMANRYLWQRYRQTPN